LIFFFLLFVFLFMCRFISTIQKESTHLGKKRKTNRNERFLFQYESSCC